MLSKPEKRKNNLNLVLDQKDKQIILKSWILCSWLQLATIFYHCLQALSPSSVSELEIDHSTIFIIIPSVRYSNTRQVSITKLITKPGKVYILNVRVTV